MSIASISPQKCAYPECTTLVPVEKLQKCGICKHTFYCGTAHQAAHLPQHKSICVLPAGSQVGVAKKVVTVAAAAGVRAAGAASAQDQKETVIFDFGKNVWDADYESLLRKYEQNKDSTFFTEAVCPFGPLRVCVDIMIGTERNAEFNNYIESIIDNPNFADRTLYNIYNSSQASLAHRAYAAHILHMRTLIRTNPSGLKGVTFNIQAKDPGVKK